MHTFTDETIEFVKINIWFLIMAAICCLIFLYPTKSIINLAILIGPLNLLFKINLREVNKFSKWLMNIFFFLVLVALILIWGEFDFLIHFPFSSIELLRCTAIFLGILSINIYVNKLRETKT